MIFNFQPPLYRNTIDLHSLVDKSKVAPALWEEIGEISQSRDTFYRCLEDYRTKKKTG